MAELDKILNAIPQRRALGISMQSGRPPVFLTAEGEQPFLNAPLKDSHIRAYLKELLDPGRHGILDERKPFDFNYRDFQVRVSYPNGGVLVRVVPAGQLPAPDGPAAFPPTVTRQTPAAIRAPAAPGENPSVDGGTGQRGNGNEIDALFYEMIEREASDLHMSIGEPPLLRIHGEMTRTGHPAVNAEQMERYLWPVCPDKNRREFEETRDTDFAYEIEGLARFRCNFFADRFGMGAVFRQIPTDIWDVKKLGLTKAVVDLCWLSKGFVVVTGPTGSGKSTTLAALVDFVNRHRTDHIITIEDPIEFVHRNKKCLINQREVGVQTQSFKRALRAALREDPDIVLVGEMRDLETIAIAIETAETGHLVFGTLHTTTAASTIDRIIDQFPADRQSQIRIMLSETLKGVIAQTLCKKIGGGRIAAYEVLIVNSACSNLIREGKTFQIASMMQTQKSIGCLTLNDSLIKLVKEKVVEPKEAYVKSIDKAGLLGLYERNNVGFSLGDNEFEA